MSTILLYTAGTLGDHLPFIALGQALAGRGHRVRLAIDRAMHPYAQRAGLEAFALEDAEHGPEEARRDAWAWDHWHNPDQAAHPSAPVFDLQDYLVRVRALIDLCQGADLLIATSIRILGYIVANALRMPWLTVSLNPVTFWQPATPADLQTWLKIRLKEYQQLGEVANQTFAALGVDRRVPDWSPGWPFARHVLLASSLHFSRPDLDQYQPQSSIDMTGFWFYQDPRWQSWQPDEALRRFCEPADPGRRPLVLAFSSQPLENPTEILARHVAAAARLDRPLLVQRGWADFSAAQVPSGLDLRQVMFADDLPHDWLFARAACAIQHGGIGSIARALRQGCPLLVEPFGNDQLYNANQVADLGVGAAVHPFESSVDDLVRLLAEMVLVPECRQRALALGAKIQSEDGLAAACEYVERYLARIGPDRSLPGVYSRFAPPLTPGRMPWMPRSNSPLR